MEATAARYDDADVLRISGRLKLFYDAASRGHDIPIHCSNCDCDGCYDWCLCRLARACEVVSLKSQSTVKQVSKLLFLDVETIYVSLMRKNIN